MPFQFGYSVFHKLEFSRGFLYISNIAVRISEAAMGRGLELGIDSWAPEKVYK